MDMDLEDVMVTGIEENMREPKHFGEFFLAWYKKFRPIFVSRTQTIRMILQ